MVTILAGRPYVCQVADFGFSDPNDNPPDNFTQVEITTLPDHGSLQLAGVAVAAGQWVSVADVAAGNLSFVPAIPPRTTASTAFNFQVADDGSTDNGGAKSIPVPKTLSINIGPVAVD